MADILPFPVVDRFPKDRPGLRKRGQPWRAIDLHDKPPQGHESPTYGPKGKVELARRQVWVEHHTQELWAIADIAIVRESFYKHDVILVPYRSRSCAMWSLAEATFRGSFQIWDEFEKGRKLLIGKLVRTSNADPERVRSFFGFDVDGYRIN